MRVRASFNEWTWRHSDSEGLTNSNNNIKNIYILIIN